MFLYMNLYSTFFSLCGFIYMWKHAHPSRTEVYNFRQKLQITPVSTFTQYWQDFIKRDWKPMQLIGKELFIETSNCICLNSYVPKLGICRFLVGATYTNKQWKIHTAPDGDQEANHSRKHHNWIGHVTSRLEGWKRNSLLIYVTKQLHCDFKYPTKASYKTITAQV